MCMYTNTSNLKFDILPPSSPLPPFVWVQINFVFLLKRFYCICMTSQVNVVFISYIIGCDATRIVSGCGVKRLTKVNRKFNGKCRWIITKLPVCTVCIRLIYLIWFDICNDVLVSCFPALKIELNQLHIHFGLIEVCFFFRSFLFYSFSLPLDCCLSW